MRALPVLCVLLLSGCAAPPEPAACPHPLQHGVVEDASKDRLRVLLDDGHDGLLHPGRLVRAADCAETTLAEVPVGASVRFDTEGWEHSNPPQASPAVVVVE